MTSPATLPARVLRCAAVGLHLDPERATSASALVDSVASLLDRELPADPAVDTLVVLPEHTGLLAMLVGERGADARARWRDGGSTLEILFALAGSYGEVLGHLSQRFPGVRSAGQLLHLACTDTLVRTLIEGFGGLAAERGVWLSVSAALPRWELVPLGHGDDGQLVALFAGGDGAGRTHAAVPTGPGVRNRQLLLSPTGELAVLQDKVSLVPLEADAEAGLGLEPASLAEVSVADLPIGRVATVISKDAWMPDVNERLDQLGAEILLQPEAFDRWGAADGDPTTGRVDLWPPDKFQRGGWWMTQRHPSFRVNIAPMLLGTLGELSFDGQPLVAVPSPGGAVNLGLLGQPADTGWAAVGEWWRMAGAGGVPPPSERREQQAQARARAAELAGSRAVAGRDVVAVARVVLPAPRRPDGARVAVAAGPAPEMSVPRPRDVGASIEVAGAPGDGGDPAGLTNEAWVELVPDLAAGTDRVWLAWVACNTAGRQQLRLAMGDGRSWEREQALSPGPEHRGAQQDGRPAGADPGGVGPVAEVQADPVGARRWRPRLALDRDGPICVHLGFPAGSWDVLAVRPGAGTPTPVRLDDADPDHGVLRERLHDAPAVLLADDEGLVAVWSDLRWPWVFPQVRLARSRDGGATWSASVRVDGRDLTGETDPLAGRSAAETRGQTTPSVAICDGRLVVAWQERDAEGVPSVRIAWPDDPAGPPARTLVRASAGGAGAGPGGAAAEPGGGQPTVPTTVGDRVARPVIAAAGATLWAVWEVWDVAGGAALWAAVSLDGGHRWSSPRAVDPGRPAGVRQQRACLVPVGQGTVTAVFSDDRAGTSSILAVDLQTERAGVAATQPVRVDDAPPGAHARAPSAARLGDELVVVWQDTRTGTDRLRSTRLPLNV